MLLLAALPLVGCAESAPGAAASDGDYNGSGDGDLPEVDGDVSGTIGIELVPPAESGLPHQQITDIDLQNFNRVLVLKRSVTYLGEVRTPDGPPAEATLRLSPSALSGSIPGRPMPNINLATNLNEDTDKAEFSITLVPDIYSLYVFPKLDSDAPSLLDDLPPIVSHDGLDLSHIDQEFKEVLWFERGLPVGGTVADWEGKPLGAVKVTAFGVDPWNRSNIVNTSILPESMGQFQLYVSTTPGKYNLVIEASEQDPLLPKMTISNAFEVSDNEVVFRIPTESDGKPLIMFEPFEKAICTISGIVTGPEQAGHAETADGDELIPIEGVKVRFSSSYIGGGSFSADTITDEDGRYSVDLLHSNEELDTDNYIASAVPPVDGQAAITMLENTIDCAADSVDLNFELNRRLLLSGTVDDRNGLELYGVEIQARKKPVEIRPGVYDTNVYVKSTFTDAEGRYAFALDSGKYDLTFIPSGSSGLSRAFLHDVVTSTDGTIDQTLNEGWQFFGKVTDDSGSGVPWVFLEVYRERPATGTSEPIGSGATNEEGYFEVILP